MNKNDIIELIIDGINSEGNGVAHSDGMAVFVPMAAVGDRLIVQIIKVNKNYCVAKINDIIVAGTGRIQPDCEAYKSCGGCDFRHINYDTELLYKKSIVSNALVRLSGIQNEVDEVVPSKTALRYRNKITLPFANEENSVACGYYAKHSHRIVPCSDCLLAAQKVNEIAAFVAEYLQRKSIACYNSETHSGFFRHLNIRKSHSTQQLLVTFVVTRKLAEFSELATLLREKFSEIDTVTLNINIKRTNVIFGSKTEILDGKGYIIEKICGLNIRLDSVSFFQINTRAAELLYAVAAELLQPKSTDKLLDLYCGIGTIGMSMAAKVEQVVGVEIVQSAVKLAQRISGNNDITNTRFINNDVEAAVVALKAEGFAPDIVVVDPPRKGCEGKTIEAMAALAPKKLLMISCNPATLARDLKELVEKGYSVQAIKPVDMFPRTKHIETVVLLFRNQNDKL